MDMASMAALVCRAGRRLALVVYVIDLRQLRRELIRDEGLRLKPYRDTVGKLTIGVGRNLDDAGIDREEALHLLDNDIRRAGEVMRRALDWWPALDDVRKRALINMYVNLGWPRLRKFRRMLGAMKRGDFDTAAAEALDSRWAEQVGKRATRIAKLIKGS
jgi:lysozyme